MIGLWNYIGWPAVVRTFSGQTSAQLNAKSAVMQAQSDYIAACVRGDTRKQRETLEAYVGAKNHQLAHEIGWRGGR